MGYRTSIARYVAKWGIALICLSKIKYQGGVSHHFGGMLNSLKKYRAIWGIAQRCPTYQLHFPPKRWKWGPQNPKSGWAGKFRKIQVFCRISTETLGPGNSGKFISGTPFWHFGEIFRGKWKWLKLICWAGVRYRSDSITISRDMGPLRTHGQYLCKTPRSLDESCMRQALGLFSRWACD